MKNIINRYIEKIKKEHTFRRRAISVLLCLALVVSVGVFWNLRLTGISMTSDVACQIEEHVHNEACNDNVLVCAIEESDEHTHEETCYEAQLICEKEEHAHTISCLSDETADVEIASDWEESLPTVLNGNWAENVLSVAKSQLGYIESEKNFILDEVDNTRKGYTRYGQWYGNLYADWNTMFMAFCLNYGEVPKEAVPRTAGCFGWVTMLTEAGLYKEATDYIAEAGDIVFFDTDEDSEADKVGIVSEVTETEIITVEGDYENSVAYVTYNKENNEDAGIVGVLDLNDAYLAYAETNAEELAKADESESEVEVTEEPADNESEDMVSEEIAEDIVTEEPINVDETDANEAVENESEKDGELIATEEPKEDEVSFEQLLARFSYVQTFTDGTLPAIVAEGTSGTISWILDENGLLSISGTGSIYNYNDSGFSSYKNQIKKIVVNEGVTDLGFKAFYGLNKVTTIELPSTLNSIYEYSSYGQFDGCSSLVEVIVDPDNEYFVSDNGVLFNKDKTYLVKYPQNKSETEYIVPDTVTRICSNSFYGCTNLKTIVLPENLSIIRERAFISCTVLETINIPDGVTSIGEYAFAYCDALETIEIPGSVTHIFNNAFYFCDSLKKVILNEGLTYIGDDAFCMCIISEINLPDSLTFIGEEALYRSLITKIEIPPNIKTTEKNILENNYYLSEIIYNAVYATSLGTRGSVSPACVITIGDMVDVLPKSFSNFGGSKLKFSGPNLIEVTEGALSGSKSTGPLYALSGEVYADEKGYLYRLDTTNKTANLIYCPEDVKEYKVPETVEVTLEGISGTYTLTGIESNAFGLLENLEKLTFEAPENITYLADKALANCHSLLSVNGETRADVALNTFKNENISIGNDIFINTQLLQGSGDSSTGVKVISETEAVEKEDSSTIAIEITSSELGQWVTEGEEFVYKTLTGNTVTVTATLDQNGSQTNQEYRIYVESMYSDCVLPYKPGDQFSFDGVDVICCATDVPGVVYWKVLLSQGSTVNVPIALYYPNATSDGGGARIWAEIVPAEDVVENGYIAPSEAIELWWDTIPNEFSLTKSKTSSP